MKGIKLVVFDMGNTLLDFHGGKSSDDEKDLIGLKRLSEYIKKKYNIHITSEMLKISFLDKWYNDFPIRESELVELNVSEYLKSALLDYDILIDEDSSLEFMKIFYSPYKEEIVVNTKALELLKEIKIKNISIGVISNCILQDEIYIDIFKEAGLDKYIDEYIFSYSNKHRKPKAILFNKMIEKFNVHPEEVVVIGDNLKADIKPANELGFKAIWYNPKKKNIVIDVNFDMEIGDFSEIMAIFN